MLRITGQTAGLIGLKIFEDTHGWPGDVMAKKFEFYFLKYLKFYFISTSYILKHQQ